MPTNLVQTAKDYAIQAHVAVNQMYGDYPYEKHLSLAVSYAEKFQYLLSDRIRDIVIAATWCHDIIEDAHKTYNDVKKTCGVEVAEIAYACTNEKGRTRAERANDKYYAGIRSTKGATFVKLCDRLANTYFSHITQSRQMDMYRKEYKHFKEQLYKEHYKDMFDELEKIMGL